MKTIIFSDLDGTLLDYKTYSFEKAKPALKLIKKYKLPLVLCSSKTIEEIEYWQGRLKIKEPFIVENGGAICTPKNYFNFDFKFDKETKKYFVIEIGKPIGEFKKIINLIKNRGIRIETISEMSPKKISNETGLSLNFAKLVKKHNYVEGLKFDKRYEKEILSTIKKHRLNLTKGDRYYHLMKECDKGKAVTLLTKIFKKAYRKVKTLGIGDSENDFEMLAVVDMPFLVRKHDGSYASNKFKKADGIGSAGWNEVITCLMLNEKV